MNINAQEIERWGIFEISLKTEKVFKNPFKEVQFYAYFYYKDYVKKVKGFYDGDNTWKIRFMPEHLGKYVYITECNIEELSGVIGNFMCIAPTGNNHGPVEVWNTYHFRHADGTPFIAMGTTLYAWFYRPEAIRRETLAAIKENHFNKIRMLFFPKYLGGFDEIDLTYEPPSYPYLIDNGIHNFEHFNVEYFKEYEKRIMELMEIGVEADVILFHFYDFGKWNYDHMTDDQAAFFMEYFCARMSAFRNIWWALSNEYDLYKDPVTFETRSKTDLRDWDRLGNLLIECDPYHHLRSIHNYNGGEIYPNREWMTHVSYQHHNTYTLLLELKYKYGKPVIAEEYKYEGNLKYAWGNCKPEAVVYSHWQAAMAGGYGTHGECYKIGDNKKDIFWTYGGRMVGESAPRLSFLKGILESLPFTEMEPDQMYGDAIERFCLRKDIEAYLYLFARDVPKKALRVGPKDKRKVEYEATVYDIWNMKEVQKKRVSSGQMRFDVPGWIAVALVRIEAE